MKKLGKRIFELRSGIEMTQAELGALVGVSKYAVSNWERGKGSPTADHLPKIAKALKTDVSSLYGEKRAA